MPMREEIKSDKIVLRKYRLDFAPLLFEAGAESRGGEFSRWMPWCGENYSIQESETFIKHSLAAWENSTEFNCAIFDAETNEFLGGVGLNQFNTQHDFVNLGYWIRVSKQNRGTASAATRALAKAAFEDLPINRIEILAAIENIPSQKVAEKAGAIREGVLRKRLLIGKRLHDGVLFSFVREDFDL